MTDWVSLEQASSMIWSNGASTRVCLGTIHGLVSTLGSSRVASISSVFASTRRLLELRAMARSRRREGRVASVARGDHQGGGGD